MLMKVNRATHSFNCNITCIKIYNLLLAQAVDAVYLTGSNKEGQFLVTATARRHNNHVQTIVYLRVSLIIFVYIKFKISS